MVGREGETLGVAHGDKKNSKHHTLVESEESSKKAKKDKRSRRARKELDEESETKDSEERRERKKGKKDEGEKKKKHKKVLLEDNANEVDIPIEETPLVQKTSKKGKEKSTAALVEIETESTHDADAKAHAEKKKKRKRDVAEVENLDESQPKKKKTKNKTGFPDPQDDSSLSEQAHKALTYAFTQFRRPSKWKFHKARQNWIIRNVWSAESIPDSHMPLVLKYLSNVQGGVRENLIKTCHSTAEGGKQDAQASEHPPDAAPPPAEQAEANDSISDNIKSKRALAILAVLIDSQETGTK